MAYRRFRVPERDQSVATVASLTGSNVAISPPHRLSVATVAAVADFHNGNPLDAGSEAYIEVPATVATIATVRDNGRAKMIAAYEVLLASGLRSNTKEAGIVARFLDDHWYSAPALGWADRELFGCYPNPAFAPVRYDSMGAVTLSALMGWEIVKLGSEAIHLENGLISRRWAAPPPRCALVWEVFGREDAEG